MDAKTARKYLRLGQVPSELPAAPRWRTRTDPFEDVWDEVRQLLEVNAALEAKTVFEYLQRREPGRFEDGQLRTLQRRVKSWRATEGPAKEVFFAQQHPPGRLGASDSRAWRNWESPSKDRALGLRVDVLELGGGDGVLRRALKACARVCRTPFGYWARCRTVIARIEQGAANLPSFFTKGER